MPYGRVLVVDDIEMNLFVARGLMEAHKLKVETCETGAAAISRVKSGRVYDIIFMDHMMPEMGGVEAMHHIRELGYTAPIIALTANATICAAKEFISKGFDDFMSKPIQMVQLDNVLKKYVLDRHNPHNLGVVDNEKGDIMDYGHNNEYIEKLRIDFKKRHNKDFFKIMKAVENGDLADAVMAAHSLKGVAGIINEPGLARAAEVIELLLHKGEIPDVVMFSSLEKEFNWVLDSIELPEVIVSNAMDTSKIMGVLAKLESLLVAFDAQCLDYLDEIRSMPEAAVLVKQIEDFDFEAAQKTLKTLTEILAERG